MLKQQVHIFLNAVMFYTRIPVPKWMEYKEEYLNKATIYFPVIGWTVGFSAALAFTSFGLLLKSVEISVLLSMIISILLTGAFHEDGFADVCDGFGGGWTKLRILEIMKDSRVGAYGVIGLVLILLLKFQCLVNLLSTDVSLKNKELINVFFLLIIAHSLSRFTAATFIYSHEYVRENDDSKAKPVAKKISFPEISLCGAFALLPLVVFILLNNDFTYLWVILPLIFVKFLLGRYFKKWIGGYTGDCLGATQQVAEIVIYLFFCIKL